MEGRGGLCSLQMPGALGDVQSFSSIVVLSKLLNLSELSSFSLKLWIVIVVGRVSGRVNEINVKGVVPEHGTRVQTLVSAEAHHRWRSTVHCPSQRTHK